ncbi:Alpha/Beta hydrolase protein [Fusarium venenatum]|uniref:Alpha/Beta hydrolase protein n=1 Tax=Fusarium venenatum TaxID=56646 RepID=UPI001D56D855|nr:Alpha/Beta hydrolase protein [Fusarium venenatum]
MADSYAQIPSGALVQPKPFKVSIEDEKVDELKLLIKLGKIAPPTYESTQKEKNFGITHQWLTDAKAAWMKFDWRAAEKHINSYNHWIVPIHDTKGVFDMHFTGIFSKKPDAVPLVMVHGWPGSFLEFLQILSILKNRYTPETLPYHVIVPSLPGFAFSSKPPMDRDFGAEDFTRVINTLMVQLGFGSGYVAQGGDLGSIVARQLVTNYEECKAMHINLCMIPEPADVTGEITEAEKKALARGEEFVKRGSAYAMAHATKPSTIGLVLSSSPLALLTWIGEKFRDWTDEEPPIDEILTSVSLYWLTDTFPTSIYAYRQIPAFSSAPARPEPKITKPFGYSWFPQEIAPKPVAWAATLGNLVYHKRHERGGHFAALERPEELLEAVDEFVKQISADGSLKI